MSDLYEHIFTNPSSEQHDNLALLGRYLILNERAIARSPGFKLGMAKVMEAASGPAVLGFSGIPLPPVAFGPAAGVPGRPGEDWGTYMMRAFALEIGGVSDLWVQSGFWELSDASVRGSALRIAYMLDYGIPHDWAEIMFGNKKSDYSTNGFIWERLDLGPGRDVDP